MDRPGHPISQKVRKCSKKQNTQNEMMKAYRWHRGPA
jgi:hypothetical protein